MCSTTSAWVNRAEWAHNPTSGSISARVISSQLGASKSGFPKHTARSNSAPTARPTPPASFLPPAGQQARGQRVILRRPGGQGRLVVGPHAQRRRLVDRPLASSSASIWALRLENARSWARVKPSISRVL